MPTPAMNAPRNPQQDEARLHALADGRLPPADAESIRAALDPATRREVDAWRQQRERLLTLHRDWLYRPVPETLRQAAERLQRTRQERRRWAAWGGVAAGWVLAFGLGWGLHGQRGAGPSMAAAPSSPLQFARQAAVAYAVYQPEQRHPVEVTADQQDHLVQWLSKRLARPLKVPHLRGQGFDLIGGRLLPGTSGARAQFMYQNAAGKRITLYLGALDGSQSEAFHFHDDGPVSSFYWVDRGFGYALSGELPRSELQTLASAVYRQLQHPPMPAAVPDQ